MVWQALFRNWVQQQARAKLHEKLAEAVKEGSEPPSDKPLPCHAGLVFALGIELGGLEDLLSGMFVTKAKNAKVRHGVLRNRGLTIIESGIGCEAAAHAAELLILGHRPPWVISAGFAGGLDPRMKREDILMVDSIVGPDGSRLGVDLKVDPSSLAGKPGVHVGRLVTTDRIVSSPEDKRALGVQHEALAVDMESWAVADVCRREQVRFLCVRVISDAVDDALPADVGRLAMQKTTAGRMGAATAALWKRPSSVKDMLKLKETALMCNDRLARFLADVIPQLPLLPSGEGAA